MLDNLIKEFIELKEQEKQLAERKKDLTEKIKSMIPSGKYEKDGLKVQVVKSTTFKYDDQTAIINYLTQKGLSDVYIVKSIDTKKLNAELKNEGALYNALKPYTTKTITESLRIDN